MRQPTCPPSPQDVSPDPELADPNHPTGNQVVAEERAAQAIASGACSAAAAAPQPGPNPPSPITTNASNATANSSDCSQVLRIDDFAVQLPGFGMVRRALRPQSLHTTPPLAATTQASVPPQLPDSTRAAAQVHAPPPPPQLSPPMGSSPVQFPPPWTRWAATRHSCWPPRSCATRPWSRSARRCEAGLRVMPAACAVDLIASVMCGSREPDRARKNQPPQLAPTQTQLQPSPQPPPQSHTLLECFLAQLANLPRGTTPPVVLQSAVASQAQRAQLEGAAGWL
jgi:hypothetical protein